MKKLTPHGLAIEVNSLMKEVTKKFVGRTDTEQTREEISKEMLDTLLKVVGDPHRECLQVGIEVKEPGGYQVVPKNLFTGMVMCGVPLAKIEEVIAVKADTCIIDGVRYGFVNGRFLVSFPKSALDVAG